MSLRNAFDPSFTEARTDALRVVQSTPGYLSAREARFLFLLSALAPSSGDVVEIGSFKGRSTIALGLGLRWRGEGVVHAIDPHNAPSSTDPDLKGQASSWEDFQRNINECGLSQVVRPYREFSQNVAPTFDSPIRVLWIDGEHTTVGARRDLQLFRPFLQPGAIVAMHDVLGTWEGSLRVYCEDVLASDDFGWTGFCGSIGWGQYLPNAGHSFRYRLRRRLLALPTRQLLPVAASGRGLRGFNKWRYKFWRPLAPHGEVEPRRWVHRVTDAHGATRS